MNIDPKMRKSVIDVLLGKYDEPKVNHTCSCGFSSFHVFGRHKSKGIMRFRCKTCGKTYEQNPLGTHEIDLKAEWDKVLQTYR